MSKSRLHAQWGNLDLRVLLGVVLTIVILVLIGDSTTQWFTRTAQQLWVFLCYQAGLLVLAVVVCGQIFSQLIEGRRSSLADLCRKNKVLRDTLRRVKSQAKRGRLALDTLRERALYVLSITRRELFLSFLLALLLLDTLLALSSMAATGYFEAHGTSAFRGLDGSASFGRHFYFVVGTMATLGNGDITPSNGYGYFFVVAIIFTGFFYFGMGLSFVIGHWFYLVNCLEKEIELLGAHTDTVPSQP